MARLFPDVLHEAEIAGVQVPVERRRVRGGRAKARRRYPYVDGQRTEDTGREPYSFTLELPMFAGVDAALWPGRFDELRLALESADRPIDYVDPYLGQMRVTVTSWDEDMDAQAQDGIRYVIELEEETEGEGPLFTIDTDRRAEAIAAAADADDALEEFGLDEADIDAILDAADVPDAEPPTTNTSTVSTVSVGSGKVSTLVSNVLTGIRKGQQQADEIRYRVNRVRAQVDAVRGHVAALTGDTFLALEALERAAASVTDVGEELLRNTQIVESVLPSPMSAWEIARLMLGDGTRADEIIAANPSANPLRYPRGTTIRIAVG